MRSIPLCALSTSALILAGCGVTDPSNDRRRLPPQDSAPGIALAVPPPWGRVGPNGQAAALAWSSDNKTLFVSSQIGPTAAGWIGALDLDANTLKAVVSNVSNFRMMASLPDNEFLFSLSSGEIRRGSRDRTTSDATLAGGGYPGFVVSADGRFIGREYGDFAAGVIDLRTGARRTIPNRVGVVLAVRDGGDEVAYWHTPPYPDTATIAVATLSAGTSRKFPSYFRAGRSHILQAAWVGDTLLVLVRDLGFPQIREVAPDFGRDSILGPGTPPRSGVIFGEPYYEYDPVLWAPAAHRAVMLSALPCTTNCVAAGWGPGPGSYEIKLLEGGRATRMARFASDSRLSDLSLSPNGRMFVYGGNKLMLKALP